MILCITPNPAIDRTLLVDHFQPYEVNRPSEVLIRAGGKGVNVARAAHTLGIATRCMGFVGGGIGHQLVTLAHQEGMAGRWTQIEAETRTCLILVDGDSGRATVVNEPGPRITTAEWDRFAEDVRAEAPSAKLIAFSGSLPAGCSVESYIDLLRELAAADRRVWVDTSGAALQAVAGIAGVGIKINHEEAGVLLGRSLNSALEVQQAATELYKQHGNPIVITMGAGGAVFKSADTVIYAPSPAVKVISNVGSGDSFFAGLLCALDNDLPEREALRWALAAGAANTQSLGGGSFSRSEFDQLLQQTAIQ